MQNKPTPSIWGPPEGASPSPAVLWGMPDQEASRTKTEMDWEEAYVQIAVLVGAHFPECEVTTVDMVRLLLHENATLRLALNIPPAKTVLQLLDKLHHE